MVDFELEKVLHAAEGTMRLRVSARMEKGTFTGLYGPSGAGKTSVLRMLAGFMKPDGGRLVVDGQVWYDAAAGINILTQKRNIGIVFQDYALFPNMNVRENIAFALTRHESRRIVDELLELTGLQELAWRRIQTLSGGQQQRVTLARAIAKKPSLLLLDEPLSAVDNVMRQQLQATLLQVHRHMGLTTILVSHNEEEITKLCDTVLHLDRGRFRDSVAPEVFFRNSGAAILQGSVVAVEGDGAVVVAVDNQLLTVTSEIKNMQPNDRVEIDFGQGAIMLRRL